MLIKDFGIFNVFKMSSKHKQSARKVSGRIEFKSKVMVPLVLSGTLFSTYLII